MGAAKNTLASRIIAGRLVTCQLVNWAEVVPVVHPGRTGSRNTAEQGLREAVPLCMAISEDVVASTAVATIVC